MPLVKSMNDGLEKTALAILSNKPLGHIEHRALDALRRRAPISRALCRVVLGTGKTTFMHQVGDCWAIAGHPVVIFEGELARASMLAKSLTRISGGELTYEDMYSGDMSVGKREQFDRSVDVYARAALPNACLLFQAKLKTQECGRQLKRLPINMVNRLLVIVDYAQIVLCRKSCALRMSESGLNSLHPNFDGL